MIEISKTQLIAIGIVLMVGTFALMIAVTDLKKADEELKQYNDFILAMFAELGNKILKDAKNAHKEMETFKNRDDLYMLNYGCFSQAIKIHDYLMEEMDRFEEFKGIPNSRNKLKEEENEQNQMSEMRE